MLIDWFTVVAQIVNFLVLVWLLKKFLYKPVLRAIDTREARLANQLAEADAKESQAREQLACCETKLHEFEQQREGMLAQARADAEQQHGLMLERARDQVRLLEQKWREDLERDRQAFLLDLRRRASSQILGITRRMIADLTGTDLEVCAVQVFLAKLRSVDGSVWSRLAGGEVAVRSAVKLSPAEQGQIVQAVQEQMAGPVRLRFEEAPGLGLGIELRANGWRIGWSADTYLRALEEDVNEVLSQTGRAGAAASQGG